MNNARRSFLQSLMLGASALAVDPERLLCTPGAKKIFIPSAQPLTFRAVEVLVGNEYRPIDFEMLRPDHWFRFVDAPKELMQAVTVPRPCEPPGNYVIEVSQRISLDDWQGVKNISLAV